MLQHDNATCHKVNIIKNWFKNNNIDTLDWASIMSKLNIMENDWSIMKYNNTITAN